MNETIKVIQDLIASNQAETVRTPYLDVALGGLRTALANTQEHVAELARQAAAMLTAAAK
jgi:hypothetical protein